MQGSHGAGGWGMSRMRWIALRSPDVLCSPALAGAAEARFEQAADLTGRIRELRQQFRLQGRPGQERAVFAAVEGKLKRRLPALSGEGAGPAGRGGQRPGEGHQRERRLSQRPRRVHGVVRARRAQAEEVLAAVDRSDIHWPADASADPVQPGLRQRLCRLELGSSALFAAISRHCRRRRTLAGPSPPTRRKTDSRPPSARSCRAGRRRPALRTDR